MRVKISDVYEALSRREKEIDAEILEQLYPDAKNLVGKTLYKCMSSHRHPSNEFEEWTITGVTVIAKDRNQFCDRVGSWSFPYEKKVTKKLVEKAKDYIEKYEALPIDMFDVLFYIENHSKFGLMMSTERFIVGSGFSDKKVSLDPKDFEEKIKADNEEYEKFYKPRDGYVACERCGKQVPIENVVKYKLIYQGWDPRFGRRVYNRIGQFCSGDCAMDEQMSLEG